MNDCACVYVEPGDYGGFNTEIIRTARKEHKCDECKKTIERGEKYEYAKGMGDGFFYSSKTCLDCISMRKSFFCHGWIYQCIWDDLDAHIKEMNGKVADSCLVPLTEVAREKVCKIIEEYWEKYEDDDEE